MRNSVPGSFFLHMHKPVNEASYILQSFSSKLLYLNIQLYYVKVHTHSLTIVLWTCNTRETKKTVLQGTFLKKLLLLHVFNYNNNSLYMYVHALTLLISYKEQHNV